MRRFEGARAGTVCTCVCAAVPCGSRGASGQYLHPRKQRPLRKLGGLSLPAPKPCAPCSLGPGAVLLLPWPGSVAAAPPPPGMLLQSFPASPSPSLCEFYCVLAPHAGCCAGCEPQAFGLPLNRVAESSRTLGGGSGALRTPACMTAASSSVHGFRVPQLLLPCARSLLGLRSFRD